MPWGRPRAQGRKSGQVIDPSPCSLVICVTSYLPSQPGSPLGQILCFTHLYNPYRGLAVVCTWELSSFSKSLPFLGPEACPVFKLACSEARIMETGQALTESGPGLKQPGKLGHKSTEPRAGRAPGDLPVQWISNCALRHPGVPEWDLRDHREGGTEAQGEGLPASTRAAPPTFTELYY